MFSLPDMAGFTRLCSKHVPGDPEEITGLPLPAPPWEQPHLVPLSLSLWLHTYALFSQNHMHADLSFFSPRLCCPETKGPLHWWALNTDILELFLPSEVFTGQELIFQSSFGTACHSYSPGTPCGWQMCAWCNEPHTLFPALLGQQALGKTWRVGPVPGTLGSLPVVLKQRM